MRWVAIVHTAFLCGTEIVHKASQKYLKKYSRYFVDYCNSSLVDITHILKSVLTAILPLAGMHQSE